jgi:hypothetical protein
MTWTKLTDRFTDDPELLDLPRGARLLYVEALVWSNRAGTDGHIPRRMLLRFTDEPEPETAAGLLVAAGKWTGLEDGWEIVDFLVDQLSAAEVERQRVLNLERTRRWRAHIAGDHISCNPDKCNAARNAARDAAPSVTPARPARDKGEGVIGGGPPVQAPPTKEEMNVLRRSRADVESLDWYQAPMRSS